MGDRCSAAYMRRHVLRNFYFSRPPFDDVRDRLRRHRFSGLGISVVGESPKYITVVRHEFGSIDLQVVKDLGMAAMRNDLGAFGLHCEYIVALIGADVGELQKSRFLSSDTMHEKKSQQYLISE